MNYNQAREYIKEKEKMGSVFGLESIKNLLFRLENPETQIPAIHIAGTNGKGSIMAFVEQALTGMGENVGRYISPTIFDYRERWKLNTKWAEEDEVAEAITRVKYVIEEMEREGLNSPTAFEIETAVFFLLAKKWNVDVNLVECGMGGRMDATNVLESDTISALASISFDHMQVLGNTLEEITLEKLGIVRDGSVLVTYPQTDEVMQVIMRYSIEHDVKLVIADPAKLTVLSEGAGGSTFVYKDVRYEISMGGEFQIYNAITAIEVLGTYLRRKHPELSSEEMQQIVTRGLRDTRWDGRFEIVRKKPLVIVDGAHNEDGWLKLHDSLEKYFTNRKFIYIIGVLADKEYHKMISILGQGMKCAFAIQSDSPRALGAEELCQELRAAGVDAVNAGSAEDAVEKALEMSGEDSDEIIIVCGTLTILGDAIKCLKSRQ